MNVDRTFRIVVGILLLVSTVTIFALLFLEIDSLAVLFNFGIDISAGNIGEAIAGAVAGLVAGLIFFFAMIFVGIINAVFGALTLALKRTKAMPMIVSIFSGLALFIGIRALIVLTLGGYTSIILPLRITSDIIVIALSITSIVLVFREQKLPRVE